MSTQTMTEKDMYLATWEREFATTVKLLKALPSGKEDFRPAAKSRNVRELAWIFVAEEKVAEMATTGQLTFTTPPPPPPLPVSELIGVYEVSHREALAKVKNLSAEGWNATIQIPVGPGKMGDARTADFLWMMVMDNVHHRGQLSVYLRLLGARVPSIYGPSADEPWT